MRPKSWASKKVGPPPSKRARIRHEGSSLNLKTQGEVEREVIPYLINMQFTSEVHKNWYEDVRHRKIQPNRYMSKSSLEMVRLFEEVCMYLRIKG